MSTPLQIAEKFALDGKPVAFYVISGGHINDTYAVDTDAGAKYILQRINSRVMKNPPLVMENIKAVTEHLKNKGLETLSLVYPKTGELCLLHEGEYYRMYDFIQGCDCFLSPMSKDDFESAGAAFGAFIEALSDMPVGRTHILPNASHDTVYHFNRFMHAVDADVASRARGVQAEIERALSKKHYAKLIQPLLASGEIPLRIIHNDTKYSNIMIDSATHKARCILDLDNVMPGTLLSDYGDSVRSGCDKDGKFLPDFMQAYTRGFLSSVKSITPRERELLPVAPLVITFENAIRYLTDYLLGDVYFKIHFEKQNVQRFNKRMDLLEDMERQLL